MYRCTQVVHWIYHSQATLLWIKNQVTLTKLHQTRTRFDYVESGQTSPNTTLSWKHGRHIFVSYLVHWFHYGSLCLCLLSSMFALLSFFSPYRILLLWTGLLLFIVHYHKAEQRTDNKRQCSKSFPTRVVQHCYQFKMTDEQKCRQKYYICVLKNIHHCLFFFNMKAVLSWIIRYFCCCCCC